MIIETVFLVLLAVPGETVGERPYEMVWAGRDKDTVEPLVDFEELEGWTARCAHAEARIERTREEQLWGSYVAKLTYRGEGAGPSIRISPPEPIPIRGPFDTVTLWVYGNNWGWAPDPSTPQVAVGVVLEDSKGEEFGVHLYNVDWTEWNLLHRRLDPTQVDRVRGGAKLKAISVTGGTNKDDRVLYFDNLAVFVEEFRPLTFEPRPERGIPMFPGQGTGTNTGPGKLPFPTRVETILPENLARDFTTRVEEAGGAFVLEYAGSDGRLTWRIEPRTGTLGDVAARWEGRGREIRPCAGGGAYLAVAGKAVGPEAAEHLGSRRIDAGTPDGAPYGAGPGPLVESRWRLAAGGTTAEVTYAYRLWGKTLVVDVVVAGGSIADVRYGRAIGLESPRLVTNPFYLYSWGGSRPAVSVSGPPEAPLFLAGNTDWCLSNASVLFAENGNSSDGVIYNGGARYVPRTDGRRNDCYERLFLTLSPRYEEVLPTIPNPPSPWKQVTGTHVWRAHGASDRKADTAYWRDCWRHGMRKVVVTDHETGWRDGGESFTFRTRAAPKKGGDPGQFEYARFMQDELGFVYGPYNNYTDFAPVNEYWSFDMVSRTPDLQLQHAWMRCYAPKPARAVEYCARLAPEIEKKFRFSTAYCDVHTAVAPWDRTDYDARVPGAGTFAAVFYSFGEIMLHQKRAWGGPVYSEGTYHYLYCGLTDGNYGQDNPYRIWKNPWLVDFDLRRMHDLCCNFGMGNMGMFYGDGGDAGDPRLDRFLAATVAFGHPGFLVFEGGMRNALRSYHMIQALSSRYCLASADDIRYLSSDGKLLDTSAAVASGAHERCQIVTRYSDGTVTAANGSPTERMVVEAHGRAIDLPPNGYAGWTTDGAVEVLSGERDGHRADYAATPSYIYVDGRGRFTRFEKAASGGIGVCREAGEGRREVIPIGGAECGFAVRAAAARALDREGKDIGTATLRTSRGLTYVLPVPGAFSYLLGPEGGRAGPDLSSARDVVVPGEKVEVRGAEAHRFQVPADAKPGERIWKDFEGRWIDFTVVAVADADLRLRGNALVIRVASHLPATQDFEVSAAGRTAAARLEPGRPTDVEVDLGPPLDVDARPLTVEIASGGRRLRLERGIEMRLEREEVIRLPERWQAGLCLRGGKESAEFGGTGGYFGPGRASCGGVAKDGFTGHPPYQTGVGYAFLLFEPVRLPEAKPAVFRAEVGKGDGSDPGDGILYRVIVVSEGGEETVAAERRVTEHRWEPMDADLAAWAGKTVRVKLVADVGRADDSTGDWACWTFPRIEGPAPILVRTLVDDAEPLRREEGPSRVAGLRVEDLRGARKGTLRFEGKGLEGPGRWATSAALDGVEIGALPAAHGDETRGTFSEAVAMPLPKEAISSLGRENVLDIRNPNGDSFSIRRFWIELELADGRVCTSDVTTATFSQPPGWPHAEGILVPEGKGIRLRIWFSR